jgi:hypothetical protein
LKGCDSRYQALFMRALLKVQDVLCICWKCDFMKNENSYSCGTERWIVNILRRLLVK